jgi:hypothetical protein
MAVEIAATVNAVITLLLGLIQVAFWIAVLWIFYRGLKVVNNFFTLKDYQNAYEKGLWHERSKKTGIPLVWEQKEQGWKEKIEDSLEKKPAKAG